jgi:D-alanyl-D-alanine carboxypeptidase/D-alanyl-D-alanine-endopeptidase (penicillin-binding protein 4)
MAQLVEDAQSRGLRSVRSNVEARDWFSPDELYPIGWDADDLIWGYGAPVSMLMINDNQLGVTLTPGATVSDGPWAEAAPAMALPSLPKAYGNVRLHWDGTVAEDSGSPAGRVYAYFTGDSYVSTSAKGTDAVVGATRLGPLRSVDFFGTLPLGSQPHHENIAVDEPTQFAASALYAELYRQEIPANTQGLESSDLDIQRIDPTPQSFLAIARHPLPGLTKAIPRQWHPEAGAGQVILAEHDGPPLDQEVQMTNKLSLNLHAEVLLRQLAYAFGDRTSTAEGARVVHQFLLNAGLDPHDFVFYDGSGLSSHDLVTPRATAKLLQYATTQPWFAAWKSSLPIGGEDGTLETRFSKPPLKDHLFAKTGTLGEARALSGYLDAASGRTVIFSIMVGNHLPGDNSDREVMDKIVAAIAAAE